MKRLLLIPLVLFLSCGDKQEKDCAEVEGGTAVLDCKGVCSGDALLDMCGICDNDSLNDCVQDCNGEWGGEATIDSCQQCVDGTTGAIACHQDCAEEWGGDAFVNACNYCVGGNTGFSENICGTVTDIDGNVYHIVIIGNRYWMVENLKVTHYTNGDEIPTGYSNSDWINLSTGAYAVYPEYDDASQETCGNNCADVYGNLYNWYAADDERGLCPESWHIPTDNEIKELEMYLGMSQDEVDSTGYRGTNEGSKLAGRADLWSEGDLENNAEFEISGFTALPGGYRYSSNGYYNYMGSYSYFWSSTEAGSNFALTRKLIYNTSGIYKDYDYKECGFSVRCIRD